MMEMLFDYILMPGVDGATGTFTEILQFASNNLPAGSIALQLLVDTYCDH